MTMPVASHFVDTSADLPSGVQNVIEHRAKRLKALAQWKPEPQPEPEPVMPAQVEKLFLDVCDAFAVAPSLVRGRDRHKTPARARHAFWYLARQFYGFSFPELGTLFEIYFDHTSVIAACRKVQRAIDAQTPYGITVQALLIGAPKGLLPAPKETE